MRQAVYQRKYFLIKKHIKELGLKLLPYKRKQTHYPGALYRPRQMPLVLVASTGVLRIGNFRLSGDKTS